jgi:tRNA pseudouridine55 synthase
MNWNSVSQIDDLVEGRVLLMNKPLFWTSFDLVKKVRGQILYKYRMVKGEKRKIKVGHAGTLDPYADGLMIICTGKKTKEIESFIGQNKKYIF